MDPIDHGEVLVGDADAHTNWAPVLRIAQDGGTFVHIQSLRFCSVLVQWAKDPLNCSTWTVIPQTYKMLGSNTLRPCAVAKTPLSIFPIGSVLSDFLDPLQLVEYIDDFNADRDPAMLELDAEFANELKELASQFDQVIQCRMERHSKALEEATADMNTDNAPTIRGGAVWHRGRPVGQVSYPIHWDPPTVRMLCKLHVDCAGHAPIEPTSEVNLLKWVITGNSFASNLDHLRALPAGCFSVRRLRDAAHRLA